MKSKRCLGILLSCIVFGLLCMALIISANAGFVDELQNLFVKSSRMPVHLIKSTEVVKVPEWQETVYVKENTELWDRQEALDRANLLVETR